MFQIYDGEAHQLMVQADKMGCARAIKPLCYDCLKIPQAQWEVKFADKFPPAVMEFLKDFYIDAATVKT